MDRKQIKPFTAAIIIFCVLFLLILVPGCEGGGGDSSDGDGNDEAEDTTPPTVVSVLPADGSTDVATNTAISVTFSEDMDTTTINDTTITVSSSAGTLSAPRNLSGAVSYANKVATFTPAAALPFSTTLSVTVTTAVTDLAGNALVAAYVFAFSTGTGPDTTPPAIEDTSGDEDEDLDPDTVVSVAFSEPVDPATLTADNIEISIRGCNIMELIPGIMDGFKLDSSGTVLSFEPPDGLARNAEYTVVLGTGITDTAGNPLASEFTWTFRTRAGTWGSPETLYTEDIYGPANPQAGFDAGGKAQVLWSAYYAGTRASAVPYATYSKRYDASQSPAWGADMTRSVDSYGSNTHTVPAVGSNRTGTAAAVWFSNWDGNEIFGDIFTSGEWTGEEQVSFYEETGEANPPAVAVDIPGNVFTAWRTTYDPDGAGGLLPEAPYLLVRRYDAENGGLEDFVNVSSLDGGSAVQHDIACDADGNAVAVWFNGDDDYIAARRYRNGDGWSDTVKRLSSTGSVPYGPRAGMDGNGNAIVVWEAEISGNNRICANRFNANDGWSGWDFSSQEIVSDTAFTPDKASNPHIAVDFASGDAVVVWCEQRGADLAIYANLYTADTDSWTGAIDVAEYTDIVVMLTACDFAGNVFILWQDGETVYAKTYRIGDEWTPSSFSSKQTVGSTVNEEDQFVHLRAGPNGRAIAVWINGDSVEVNVFE